MKNRRRLSPKKSAQNTHIYVDQSGKVEYTSKHTVVAYSNGKKSAITIKAKDKRVVQDYFRKNGRGQIFVFWLFSYLIYVLIRDADFKEVTIDTEYPGKSDLIKNYIMGHFLKHGKKISPSSIHFHEIGRKCEAHWHAYYVFTEKRKSEKTVLLKGVLREVPK